MPPNPGQAPEVRYGVIHSVQTCDDPGSALLVLEIRMSDDTFRSVRVSPLYAASFPLGTRIEAGHRLLARALVEAPSLPTPTPTPKTPRQTWRKGEPYPESWPQWLKNANIEYCDVEINGHVIWHHGIWESGAWFNGTWKNGIWRSGSWYNGIWKSGTWDSGFWETGVWENGTWRNGTWETGTWENGIWRDGVWYSGTWKDGHQEKPRFGWAVEQEGTIRGFSNGWQTLSPEEWQPRLKDMDPQKVLEFELLVSWSRQVLALKKGQDQQTSVWDIIQD